MGPGRDRDPWICSQDSQLTALLRGPDVHSVFLGVTGKKFTTMMHFCQEDFIIFANNADPDERQYFTDPQISVKLKIIFYFSTETCTVGAQKNRLDETVLLSTQNTCLN